MGFTITWRTSFPGAKADPPEPRGSSSSQAAGEPAGHNHRKHRQNEIGHLHCLQAERVALSGTVLSPSNNVHAEAIGRERVLSGRQISSGRPLRSRGARTIVRPAFRRASPQPCGALGRSQAVRQRILIPPYGGSNPPAPASHLRFLYQHVAFDCGLAAQGKRQVRGLPCAGKPQHMAAVGAFKNTVRVARL
jgi:hypothetical protein